MRLVRYLRLRMQSPQAKNTGPIYNFTSFHPSNGFTVAQFGPPSFPVPGTRVSRTVLESRNARSIISELIPLSGTFTRLLHSVPICPANLPIPM